MEMESLLLLDGPRRKPCLEFCEDKLGSCPYFKPINKFKEEEDESPDSEWPFDCPPRHCMK